MQARCKARELQPHQSGWSGQAEESHGTRTEPQILHSQGKLYPQTVVQHEAENVGTQAAVSPSLDYKTGNVSITLPIPARWTRTWAEASTSLTTKQFSPMGLSLPIYKMGFLGAWADGSALKCLPSKHKDLSSDSQKPLKKPNTPGLQKQT